MHETGLKWEFSAGLEQRFGAGQGLWHSCPELQGLPSAPGKGDQGWSERDVVGTGSFGRKKHILILCWP